MNNKKILFTIAVNVKDRPIRWKSIGKIYSRLNKSLKALNYECKFYVNDDAMHKKLKNVDYTLTSSKNLKDFLDDFSPDIVFIWGGRTVEDKKTIEIIKNHNKEIKIIYSELGWFPQKNNIYFDMKGTNSEASFCCDINNYELSKKDLIQFNRLRDKIIRKDLNIPIYKKSDFFKIEKPDLSKPILVPLQDESDTNITLASPFKKMKHFIEFLLNNYPQYKFVIRQHPNGQIHDLPKSNNIIIQNNETSIFKNIDNYGMVIGINSTVLLQSALHNKTVVAVGNGIASYGGCSYMLDLNNPIRDLSQININSCKAKYRLTYLLIKKQLDQKKLSNLKYFKKTYLYNYIK